ncbi:MAG: cell division protein SepF [Fimbriimonadaceae bacterium]
MEDTVATRQGLFGRVSNWFTQPLEEGEDYDAPVAHVPLKLHTAHRYSVTVRRQVRSFQDAVAAADGLKRGEQQILNLTMAPPETRERIKNFMAGVNYTAEGSWEELGDDIFMLAPSTALVEVAAAASVVSERV